MYALQWVSAILLHLSVAVFCDNTARMTGRRTYYKGEYRHVDDSQDELTFSHAEKVAYFHTFLVDFPFSMDITSIVSTLAMVLNRVPDDDIGAYILVDVGANVGNVSTALIDATRHGSFSSKRSFAGTRQQWGKRRLAGVVAIEANSMVFASLKSTVERRWPPQHELPAVLWHAIACGPDDPNVMSLTIPHADDSHFTSWQLMSSVLQKQFETTDLQHANHSYFQVRTEILPAHTVHDFFLKSLEELGILEQESVSVFLLKIDVEGYDDQVLRGSYPILQQTLFIIFEQVEQVVSRVVMDSNFVPISQTLEFLWESSFGCFAITGFSFVPVSARWFSQHIEHALVQRPHDIFCGNLRHPDVLHHAVELVSLYAMPNKASNYDYRQRQFVHDAIEDYVLLRFGPKYESAVDLVKKQIIHEYMEMTEAGMVFPKLSSHASPLAGHMIGDSPDQWDQEKALQLYRAAPRDEAYYHLTGKNASVHGLDAAILLTFGHESIRNRTAAIQHLEASVSVGLHSAYPLLVAIRDKVQMSPD